METTHQVREHDIERYIRHSGKIATDDLDWEAARRVGLTPDEAFVLTYFSDIESQTIRYLRALLSMEIALEPDTAAFLTTWSYEEFFHGRALAKLLEVAGYELSPSRVAEVKAQAKLNEWIERVIGPCLSRLFVRQFPAVYMAFGSIQELTTLRGYERLGGLTQNPVLKVLCERIAKQERRHFAWYFNRARQQLERDRSAQVLTRMLLRWNWVPVGAGVKSREEVFRLFHFLFEGEVGRAISREIDEKMRSLPGLGEITLMQAYFAPVLGPALSP